MFIYIFSNGNFIDFIDKSLNWSKVVLGKTWIEFKHLKCKNSEDSDLIISKNVLHVQISRNIFLCNKELRV